MAADDRQARPRRISARGTPRAATSPSAAEDGRSSDTRTTGNGIRVHGLADIRKASNLTQKQLADRLETDQGTVSRIERRDDLLLSTIRQYLAATGSVNARIVVEKDGVEMSLSLSDFA